MKLTKVHVRAPAVDSSAPGNVIIGKKMIIFQILKKNETSVAVIKIVKHYVNVSKSVVWATKQYIILFLHCAVGIEKDV